MTKTDSKRSAPVTYCTFELNMRINIGRGGKTASWLRQGCFSLHVVVLFKILRRENWYFQVHRYRLSLYNDVNAKRAVIGCCPWSIRVQIHGWRRGKLVFFVLFNMARRFEMFVRLFPIKASESLEKSLAGAIYKEEKWRTRDKKSSWLL